MSYRRQSPPSSRHGGPPSSSSSLYGGGRGGYDDRRPPPPPGRGYRDEYESRGSRRSVSPPYSRGSHSGRDRRDDRYEGRRDRDYSREGPPPPPRDERSTRHAAPPQPRNGDNDSRRRQHSPPRRAERDRRDEDVRGRERRTEPEDSRREVKTSNTGDADDEEGEAQEETEDDMMAAMGFGGFGTTKNTKVDGNQMGTAEIKKERTWRQYMQRKGGFNRPLSPVRKR